MINKADYKGSNDITTILYVYLSNGEEIIDTTWQYGVWTKEEAEAKLIREHEDVHVISVAYN